MTDTGHVEAPTRWAAMDEVVAEVRAGLPSWLHLPIEDRVELLRGVQERAADAGPELVAAGCAAHGVGLGTIWEGDQWLGVLSMSTHARSREVVLRRLADGHDVLPSTAVTTRPDGQACVSVVPATRLDRVVFTGVNGSVWLQPEVAPARVARDCSAAYRGGGFPDPGACLVLAAGNSSGLPATDILNQLYAHGCTAVVKLNPVNDYAQEFLERIFADFVAAGWVRFVTGGADTGHYLAHHDGIDRLHVTGSARTYDALVWGVGEQGTRNRARGQRLLTKPFTAELGGASPTIVVPGAWRRHDLRRWADRIAFQKLCNAGHFCNSTQVLVLPQGWDQGDTLLDDLRGFLRTLPPQQPFYPGTDERVARAIEGEPGAEALLPPDRRYLVTGLDPDGEASLFRDEVFADVLGVVRLPATSVGEYLAAATRFANDRLTGTLAAQILVDPDTAATHAAALDRCIAGLRYGTVAVNEWVGMAYGTGFTTWGAFPGHTPRDIGSGVGVVGNAVGLPGPQRTVLTGPFRAPTKPATCATFAGRAGVYRALVDYYAGSDPRALLRLYVTAARP